MALRSCTLSMQGGAGTHLLGGDAAVAEVVQPGLQALGAPAAGPQVLGQDLLELPGHRGNRDGVPHLDQHGLVSGEREGEGE